MSGWPAFFQGRRPAKRARGGPGICEPGTDSPLERTGDFWLRHTTGGSVK